MRHVVVLRRTLTGKIVVAGKTDGQQLLAFDADRKSGKGTRAMS